MPTAKQIAGAAARRERIIGTVKAAHDNHQAPPTLSELAAAHGVSFQQISKDVARLVREGRLGRDPGTVRSIHITRLDP